MRELKELPGADKLQDLCGLPLSTYPSSVKLMWLLRNVDAVKKAYDEGRLTFGTMDTWILYHLNGKEKKIHITDTTNASRTMFMNLAECKYDDTLLNFFGLDQSRIRLPKIVPSSCPESYGTMGSGLLKGITISGCLGDQSAALVGQQGFTPGSAKNTYGTGCFLLYNVGETPSISKHGLLGTVAYDFGRGRKPVYALEGSIAVAGSGVKFLMKNMGFIAHSHKVSELAATVKDNGGCVFVTAFSGLFAPYWIDDARGTIFGITPHTERGHIARATLEATCYQTKAIIDAMEKDSGHRLTELAVDGGMSNSDLCMQVSFHLETFLTMSWAYDVGTYLRPKQTLSAFLSTVLPCAKPLRLGPRSLPASPSTYGKSLTSSRRLTRRIVKFSNQTSRRNKALGCLRNGKRRWRCAAAG